MVKMYSVLGSAKVENEVQEEARNVNGVHSFRETSAI